MSKSQSQPGIEQFTFGQPVENIAASEDNPIKRGIFVRAAGRMVEYVSPLGLHGTPADNIRAPAHCGVHTAGDRPQVSIKPMALSGNRTGYFVSIKVGDREVTPHVFRDEYKSAYHVALYDWLLNGTGKEPDVIEFGPHDWPARAIPPVDPTNHHNALKCPYCNPQGLLISCSVPSAEPLPAKPEPARWPAKGDTMTFIGKNGYPYQLEAALKIFTPGEKYRVHDCEVGDFSHSIEFVGVKGRFNGVMFELSPSIPSTHSGRGTD